MKYHWTNSKKRWKDSVTLSLAILTGLQTIIEVCGLFATPCIQEIPWWGKLCIIVAAFLLLLLACFIFKQWKAHKGITFDVNDNEVSFKQADIFKQDGWRLIPFNENFDTKVDDIVIAHNTLNGVFIDRHVKNKDNLENSISNIAEVKGLESYTTNGIKKYPLGRIIPYDSQYLLLAFTHFEDNNATLSHSDFEKCLITMWREIDRVYASVPIFIPLLGSGITRFVDTPHKDMFALANCLLCTLKISGVHIKQPITICLTPEAMDNINLYELKSK